MSTGTRTGDKAGGKAAAKRGTRTAVRNGTASASAPARRTGGARAEADGRRRRRRRVLAWTLGVVTLVVVAMGAAAFSPVLDVEAVEVVGVPPDRVAAVRDAAGIEVGDSIVTFLPGTVAGRVRDLAWVGEVDVVRELPNVVRIEVVPRIPVGWTRAGARVLVVDAASRVLEKADVAPPGIPELGGVADVAPVGGEIAPRSLAAAAGALGPELRMRTAAVTLADGAVTAQVAGGPQLRFGGPRGMATKARVAAAVLASSGDAPITYIDVSVPSAPVSG